jgi:CPA2 family monovalent cation:H+ antiporter-2
VALAAVGLAAVTAATKVATGWWAAGRAGIGRAGRLRAGTVLIAHGEFSIVIAGLAVAAGLHARLGPLAATYVLLLAVLGPLITRAADSLAAILRPSAPPAAQPQRSPVAGADGRIRPD